MKTETQIKEWLDNQSWKQEFLEEFLLGTKYRDQNWGYNTHFIDMAFCWAETKSGFSTWQCRNIDFLKWFDLNLKVKSYKEYCKYYPIKENDYLLNTIDNKIMSMDISSKRHIEDYAIMSEELCNAFVAYMKLIQLRNSWEDSSDCPYKIITINDKIIIRDNFNGCKTGLSFKDIDTAKEFINAFKDLLEVSKPLL